jgi:hypothetical protein
VTAIFHGSEVPLFHDGPRICALAWTDEAWFSSTAGKQQLLRFVQDDKFRFRLSTTGVLAIR